MKIMRRDHNFSSRLNHVIQKVKYYYLSDEKSMEPTKVRRTVELDNAFENENWKAFDHARMLSY